MSKGNYTHVQELSPEIEAMLASGYNIKNSDDTEKTK